MQRILRNSIEGITKPAIARLARKAGVKRMGDLSYEEIKGNVREFLENAVGKAIANTELNRRTTVLTKDVETGLPVKMFSEDVKKKLCEVRTSGQHKSGEHKKRRAKPGTNSIREIRYYQKCSFLILPRLSFSRLVREVAQDFKTGLRFSADAVLVLQYAVEKFVIELLKDANLAAIHAKRTTVQPKDIQMGTKMLGESAIDNPGPMPPAKIETQQKFDIYIKKILKLIHPNHRISKDSVSQVNFIANQVAAKLGLIAKGMLTNKKTIDDRMLSYAIDQFFPGEIRKHAKAAGIKAIEKFFGNTEGKQTTRSGLEIPPSRVRKIIADTCKTRISPLASVYCAAVVEYIIAEIVELAGNSATDKKRNVISSRDLYMAINHDEELKSLVRDNLKIEILTGSVIPNIHSVLLPKKSS